MLRLGDDGPERLLVLLHLAHRGKQHVVSIVVIITAILRVLLRTAATTFNVHVVYIVGVVVGAWWLSGAPCCPGAEQKPLDVPEGL
jgi:hypothetical protein